MAELCEPTVHCGGRRWLWAPPAIPAWIVNRLDHVDLNHGSVAKYLEHLAYDATTKANQVVVKADQVADALHLDDELLDSLLAGLTS